MLSLAISCWRHSVLGLSRCPCVQWSHIKSLWMRYQISYKLIVWISPYLQHRCSWGQRSTALIWRSKVKVATGPNMVKNHLFKNAPFWRVPAGQWLVEVYTCVYRVVKKYYASVLFVVISLCYIVHVQWVLNCYFNSIDSSEIVAVTDL